MRLGDHRKGEKTITGILDYLSTVDINAVLDDAVMNSQSSGHHVRVIDPETAGSFNVREHECQVQFRPPFPSMSVQSYFISRIPG